MARAASTKVKPQERIIEAAGRLFLSEGIHAVGVDRLTEEAAVSKRSLYQHFTDKYDVVQGMLERVGPKAMHEYLPPEDDATDPRDRIVAVFDDIRRLSMSPRFYGCPFVNVASELRDTDHPGSQTARRFKLLLTAFFERQARLAGAPDPESTAVHLTMLFDGACAYTVVQGKPIPETTRSAAAALVRADWAE